MLKYAAAMALLLASGPVFAQAAAQTPATTSGSQGEPQSANSLPPGAATMNLNSTANPNLAGQALGSVTTTAPTAQPPMNTPTTTTRP